MWNRKRVFCTKESFYKEGLDYFLRHHDLEYLGDGLYVNKDTVILVVRGLEMFSVYVFPNCKEDECIYSMIKEIPRYYAEYGTNGNPIGTVKHVME